RSGDHERIAEKSFRRTESIHLRRCELKDSGIRQLSVHSDGHGNRLSIDFARDNTAYSRIVTDGNLGLGFAEPHTDIRRGCAEVTTVDDDGIPLRPFSRDEFLHQRWKSVATAETHYLAIHGVFFRCDVSLYEIGGVGYEGV